MKKLQEMFTEEIRLPEKHLTNKVVYGYNGHGDVVNYTNINGQVLQLYAYDEFGNVVLDSYIGIINACHINRFFQITETRS